MEKCIDLLKSGTKIVLTKEKVKRRKFFMIEVGQSKAGTLVYDCKIGSPLSYKKCEGVRSTSAVEKVFEENNSLFLETESSIYSVRIVIIDNDEEFNKLILI